MGLLAECPPAAEIADVDVTGCQEQLGQIQKVIFQRKFSTGSTRNKFVIGSDDPELLASWTSLLSASDGTKVVQSPFISGPATEPGAARTYGGGNDTIGGIEIVIGREPTTFTANMINVRQKAAKALKQYMTETLQVYLVDEHGQVAGLHGATDDPDSPTDFMGIPIRGFFIGDKNFGGLEEVDMNTISWAFEPNWSDNLYIIKPSDFDPLNDLVSP